MQFKREKASGEYSVEKMILGTHTSDGEQNYLMIAEARIPNENAEIDGTKYTDRDGGMCCGHFSQNSLYSQFNLTSVILFALIFM